VGVTADLDVCPHGYRSGERCPSGFCGDGSGAGIVVESDLMRSVLATREAARASRIEPGRLLHALDMAFRAEARGWGPDVTEITLGCPEKWCGWSYTYQDSVTLGEMVERIAAHEHQFVGPGENVTLAG
jgi:hypothetical protein